MTGTLLEYLSILFILTNFSLLASSRLGTCIKAVTVQGVVLAIMPVLHEWNHLLPATVFLSLVTLIIKGFVFPRLLHRAISRARVKREVEPLISYNASLLLGVAMLVFGFWLQTRIPIPGGGGKSLLLPASFFAIQAGFFVTFARRKALTQILGYLVLENGIFAFGAATLSRHPLMLEMGILLDVLVGVFIMGIAIFNINREFQHMDADRLASLRDPSGRDLSAEARL